MRRAKPSLRPLFGDLSLLISLTVARLMVWQILRRQRRERAMRLKRFRLIRGGGQAESEGLATPWIDREA